MTIGEKPSTADYLLRGWESDLAKGAVADRMTANQKNLASVIVGSTTTGTDGSGRTSELFNGMSDVVTGQQFAAQATKRSDEEIERSIREFAASNGVTVSRLDILHPLGPALRITFANVPTQAAILTSFSDSLRREFLSERPDYEGFFVQLEDVDGSLIMINTTAYRGGSGRLWVDPQYDSALGIPHSGQAPSLRALQDEGEKP